MRVLTSLEGFDEIPLNFVGLVAEGMAPRKIKQWLIHFLVHIVVGRYPYEPIDNIILSLFKKRTYYKTMV